MHTHPLSLGSCLALAFAIVACQATPEQITTWKGTQKGPQKLREVVKDKAASPQLRALATAALIEIGMGPEAAQDRADADPEARAKIARELVAPLAALLGESTTQAVPTTPPQRAAKDALFLARADAEPSDRARIDEILLKWTTVDLSARATQGGQSTEKILTTIGPAAAPVLVGLAKPGPELVFASQLIGVLGDRDAQKRAAEPLIASVRGGGSGSRGPQESLLQALGLIGGADATALLLEIAARSDVPTATRQKALYALAQGHLSAGDEKALTGSLAIIHDARAPGEVREAAFQVAEKLGAAAVGGLTTLFTDHDSVVRFRAVEAALHAGGANAIAPVLAALPEDRPVKSEDLDSFVVHDLGLIGKEGLPAILRAAKGEGVHGLGQVAAIRSLERQAGADALSMLGSLSGNTATVRSLVPATQVAVEARRAADAIGKRH